MPQHTSTFRRALGVLVAATLTTLLAACAPATPDDGAKGAPVVRVPGDVPTISEAVDAVAAGGLVLVEPGVYPEQVLIDTPDVTLRGLDRDQTVIDAEGTRPYGVVAVADGVSVENLTVTRATFYGVLVTGLHDESGPTAHGVDGYSRLDPEQFPPIQRFSIDHVTAYNNGLYGLYAFNAQHGVIRDSYASGSADSGIYVGQCEECDVLVEGNVAENNAVGFENANASDSVYVLGNRFSGNRVGMTFLSNYQEAFAPQRGNTVIGNLVADNARADSPAHADGAFGIGVGIGGGTQNVFERNLIASNPRAGVLLNGTEDLPAVGNRFTANAFTANGIDVANSSAPRTPARSNCFDTTGLTALPPTLLAACADGLEQPSVAAAELPPVAAPPGVSFLRVGSPPSQPDMTPTGESARALPASVSLPDFSAIPPASPELLLERARR